MTITFDASWPGDLHETRIGFLSAKIVCIPSDAVLLEEIKVEEKKVREKYKLENIKLIPTITEARKGYKIAGNDPNRYRPSADSLLRRIVKGQELYLISNVVDALNLVTIRTGFSIGAYNEQAIQGSVCLGLGKAGEEYSGIGRGKLNITNLPILRDDIGAFGSPTSDSIRTMITHNTIRIALVFFDFGSNRLLDDALTMMKTLLHTHCEGSNMTSLSIDIN